MRCAVVIALCFLLCFTNSRAAEPSRGYRSRVEEMAHNPPAACRSVTGFAPFTRSGKLPGAAIDLNYCRGYRLKTCCGVDQTNAIRRSLHFMALDGASEDCKDAWSALQCSICDPRAGTQKVIKICLSACTRVHDACKNDFFALDGASGLLAPCRGSDTICSRLQDFSPSAEDTCKQSGFLPVDSSFAGDCVSAVEPAETFVRTKERSPFATSTSEGTGGLITGAKWLMVLACAAVAAIAWPQWVKRRKQQQTAASVRFKLEAARARQQATLSSSTDN